MQAYRITRAPRFYDTVLNLPCSLSLTPQQIADVVALVAERRRPRGGRSVGGWTWAGRLVPGGLHMSADGGTVVVLGGGGHAKVLISVIRKLPWTIAGYVDPRDVGPVLGVPHAGGDDVLPALLARHPGCAAAMGVGKVDATARRARIQAAAEALGYAFPTFVSPDAVVNCEVELGGRHGRLRRGRRQRGRCHRAHLHRQHQRHRGARLSPRHERPRRPRRHRERRGQDRRPHLRRRRSRGHPRRHASRRAA